MIQKVLRVGTSAAVTIPKESLLELGLKIGDRVKVSVDADDVSVVIRPALEMSKNLQKTASITSEFINKYRKDLEALADK
ncbi:MAG: AbrB/MazE/SpoVT family DNA-binding domain-containing protein [Patescibacteria group bacterium]